MLSWCTTPLQTRITSLIWKSLFCPGFTGLFKKMGVEIQTLIPGDGHTFPKPGQIIVVHYTGTLEDGTKFDSSRDRGAPFKFRLGRGEVIKGWDQGIAQMSVGERATLRCSPDVAYGSRGHPGIIPPNAVLIFDVEILRLEP